MEEQTAPSLRTLEPLWWAFLAGAILVPALIGVTILTLISLALMLLYRPSRILRAR